MIKNAVQIGNPIVRAKSLKVTNFREAKTIVKNLIDSMRHYGLVGMAAPQIGVNQRIFVSEIRQTKTRKEKDSDPVRIFINPRIISRSTKSTVLYEGCGSVDYGLLFGPVKRPSEVTVRAYDLNGKHFTLMTTGLLAKIMQHEIDHLNGVLCIDKFMDTKKIMHREEYLKIFK